MIRRVARHRARRRARPRDLAWADLLDAARRPMTDRCTTLFLESIDVSHVAPADAERARLSTALQLLVDDHCDDLTPLELDALGATLNRLVGLIVTARRRRERERAAA